VRRSWLW